MDDPANRLTFFNNPIYPTALKKTNFEALEKYKTINNNINNHGAIC